MSSGMTTNAELKLKIDGFTGPMTTAQESAVKTGVVVKKAAKEAADAQAAAAKYAGDEISKQSIKIVEANRAAAAATKEYAAVQRLVNREALEGESAINAEAAALQRKIAAQVAAAAASRVETHAVSERMAASAVVRGIESGNVGIRAVENTLVSLGAGGLLQKAFSVIGPVALAAAVAKVGFELYDVEQKGKHAGEELSRAFGEMNVKLEMSNDSLELANSKLADEIAKLEKRPGDGFHTAMTQAIADADRLQTELAGATKELQNLLKEHSVGAFEGALAGVAGTYHSDKFITDDAKSFEREGQDARVQLRKNLQDAGSDRAKQLAANNSYYARMGEFAAAHARTMRAKATEVANYQKTLDNSAAEVREITGKSGTPTDMTPVRSSYEDSAVAYDNLQRHAQDSVENLNLTQKKGALEGVASTKKDGDKGAEELLKSMEAQLNELKLQYGATTKAQYDFWEVRRSEFVAGSNAYNQVVARQAALAEEGARKGAETIKRFTEQQRKDSEGANAIQETIARTNYGMARDGYNTVNDTADAKRQLEAVQQGVRAKVEEQSVQDALNRTMTQAAAAAELARIHTREYGAELERLKAKQAQVANDPYLTDDQKAKQLGELADRQATIEGNRQIQQMQDARANDHSGTSGVIGAKDALDELAISARDSASQMRSFVETTTNSINETILRQITGKGQRGDWTNLGQSVFSNVAGTALKNGEGALLSGLGFGGKADGSESNPLWVKIVGDASSGASATGGFLKSLFKKGSSGGGSSDDSSGSGSGDGGGGFLGKIGPILSNIPFFADGVDNFGGGLAMVGERGPELVNLPKGSGVIPNGVAFGGGDVHHHTHTWDLRGAGDPAQVRAVVQQEFQRHGPSLVAASVKATHEYQRRRPSSSR